MTKQTKIKHYTKRDYAAFAYLAPLESSVC